MVNINKIQSNLVGLVGFKQPYNPNYAILDTDNILSESGYFVTDNPFVKIEYIKDNQDYLNITDEDFNALIVDLKKTAITDVVNQVFSDYDFIDRSLLFKNASNKVDTETLPIGFVGYKIQVSTKKNIAFKINRVLLDFAEECTIELLLFNTSKKEPIQQKTIDVLFTHQEEVLNWVVDNSNDTYKGDYYLGYISTNLIKPYKREWQSANILTNPTYLNIERVCVDNHSTNKLFNLDLVDGLSEDSGLNLDISVFEDFTDFVLNNKMLFARAMQLSCVIKCVNLYLSSLRLNANNTTSNQLYQKIMVELEGTDNEVIKSKGLRSQLLTEITSIKNEIQKLQKGFFKTGQIMVQTLI